MTFSTETLYFIGLCFLIRGKVRKLGNSPPGLKILRAFLITLFLTSCGSPCRTNDIKALSNSSENGRNLSILIFWIFTLGYLTHCFWNLEIISFPISRPRILPLIERYFAMKQALYPLPAPKSIIWSVGLIFIALMTWLIKTL